MWKVIARTDRGIATLPKLFGTWEDAREAIPTDTESQLETWEVVEVESYADEDSPPICLHAVGQGLVNALWMELRYTQALLDAANGGSHD